MHHSTLHPHRVEEKQQEHPCISKPPRRRVQKFTMAHGMALAELECRLAIEALT